MSRSSSRYHVPSSLRSGYRCGHRGRVCRTVADTAAGTRPRFFLRVEDLVLWSVNGRHGNPDRAVHRIHTGRIAARGNDPARLRIDSHPRFLGSRFGTLDVVPIDLRRVEHPEHVAVAPDASLPVAADEHWRFPLRSGKLCRGWQLVAMDAAWCAARRRPGSFAGGRPRLKPDPTGDPCRIESEEVL